MALLVKSNCLDAFWWRIKNIHLLGSLANFCILKKYVQFLKKIILKTHCNEINKINKCGGGEKE